MQPAKKVALIFLYFTAKCTSHKRVLKAKSQSENKLKKILTKGNSIV